MILQIILLIVFGVSLLVVLAVFIRKLPQVRIIEPDSAEGGKTKRLKNEIVRQRIERASTRQIEKIQRSYIQPLMLGAQNLVRRFAGRLLAVEQRYQEKRKQEAAGGMTRELAQEYIKEAKQLIADEQYDKAEKKLIEVISAHPRHAEAYEKLGRLYLKKRDFESAKETFQFLAKIVPKDASVNASMGEVELGMGQASKALKWFQKAVQLSPNNSRYIDFLIETAILTNDKVVALDGLKTFTSLNPESQKIAEFKKRIKDINILKKP